MLGRSFFLDSRTDAQVHDFMKKFMLNGRVKRKQKLVRSAKDNLYTNDFLQMHIASTRSACRPQDYILATMLQYPWYKVPPSILQMEFTELFHDFNEQCTKSEHPLTCRLTRSMVSDTSNETFQADEEWQPSRTQPEPRGLGEFFKLIGKRTKAMDNPKSYYITAKVDVFTIGPNDIDMTFTVVESAIKFSWQVWLEASLGGELGRYGDQPEQTSDF